MVPDRYSHIVLILEFKGITRYVTEAEEEKCGSAIGEMSALRWEPTHITKHCPRSIPLQVPWWLPTNLPDISANTDCLKM